jgi:hypothetical protein
MENKRKQLIELNTKKKQAKEYLEACEEEYKALQEELICDAEDKFTQE